MLTWDHVDLDARTISVWRSVRAHGDTSTARADAAPGREALESGGAVQEHGLELLFGAVSSRGSAAGYDGGWCDAASALVAH